ncbi:ABC transporter substrate-binding protein [Gracilibacillus kekensis]|uniref:Peptide/nickel transport system substrate-binding protein n=1 Tax=Gracilibacillus kekensis TaxID=1027249 RepID=A0A1M7PXK4_9BACI|nr:ABC transporter substrate-binding protein [Gracilibacillus kekensis]SHN22376.1 peptide/nickel transport system substrate-binding protein [Gracilibacillus kekensis]
MRFYVILFSLMLLVFGCSNKEIPEETKQLNNEKTLTLAIGGEPDNGFDPTTGWGRYGSALFQSTLLAYNKDLEITYDLATDYHVSEDGRSWTVALREDATFSDGESVTADDVIFTFETAQQAQSIVDVANIAKIEKVNDFELIFHLSEPQSTFVHTLQTLGIVPEHAYDSGYSQNPIGSGPYQLVEWRKGEQLMVESNPHYYGKEPEFKQLTFLFVGEDQALAAAKAGQVDVLSVPITMSNQEIEGMNRLSLQSVDNRGVMLPFPPASTNEEGEQIGNDITSDLAIRRALNYAVDRQAIVDGVLDGEGTVAYSSVDQLPWQNPEVIIEDGDPNKAEQILLEAGWQRGPDDVFEKDGKKASLTLYYPTDDQMRQSLSLVFADMATEFGIEVKTKGASWNEIEKQMHEHPVMMGWGSHNPLELYSLYHSDIRGMAYYNANYYQNEKVDHYLEQALAASSEEDAYKYWKLAQWDGETGMSVLGDAPWVWLVNLNHIYFINEQVEIGEQKVQPHGHGWPITDFITDWQLID